MVKFKRSLTLSLFEDNNFCSGDFTFRRGYYYECKWINENTICIYYNKNNSNIIISGYKIKEFLELE